MHHVAYWLTVTSDRKLNAEHTQFMQYSADKMVWFLNKEGLKRRRLSPLCPNLSNLKKKNSISHSRIRLQEQKKKQKKKKQVS